MARTLPGSLMKFDEDDWDSFESILEPSPESHTNGGSPLLSCSAQTPVKRASQNCRVAEPSRPGIYPSLPSPETTPLHAQNKSSGVVFGRLFAQTQLQSPPGTPERVFSPQIPAHPRDASPRTKPPPQEHRTVSALPIHPKILEIHMEKSEAYATPPVTPTRPKRLHRSELGYPRRQVPNIEALRGLASRLSKNISKLEESLSHHKESHTVPGSPIPTASGSPTAVSIRTLDEDSSDDASSRVASAKSIKDKRPSTNATPQHHLGDLVRLSNAINEQSTSTRPVGLCPKYADPNWTDYTPEGPPAFFYKLPPALPHLALWSAGGVGIFSNGQSLKYFQACDVAVLVTRERGEKVCDTETVNDVGHILHYEMGLGKTVTTIALIICNPASPKFRGSHATLVVTPNKGIMDHWLSEIAKFAPHLRVCYYDSANAHLSDTADIVVCTYNQLRQQHGIYLANSKNRAPLFQRVWFRVVLDEAHVARNPETKTAESIWALKKSHGLCLTGTPAQNSNHDLYSLFRFLEVTYENINDLETFQSKVCSSRPKDIPRNSKILDILKRDFRIARNRSLITLPKRTDTTIQVTLNPQERHLYSSVKKWKGLHILAKIIRLRQVCDHPSLIGEELLSEFIHEDEKLDPEDDDYKDEELNAPYVDVSKLPESEQGMFSKNYMSSKIRELMRILKTRVPGQKTIIFTHFVSVIPSITNALNGAGIRWTTYSGDMTSKSRESSLKKIAQDAKCTVIIVSIMAGGVGLNITACNTVILLDPWWNPSAEEQAISRSYRIGQNLPVHVFRLVVKDSIEESIEKTQIFKREMMKDMSGQCPPIDKCTFEEWLAGP